MADTIETKYDVFVSTSFICWDNPKRAGYFIWGAVYFTKDERASLRTQLSDLKRVTTADVRKYLFEGGAKRSPDILARLSKMLGSTFHTSSAYPASREEDLTSFFLPTIMREINGQLQRKSATGTVLSNSLDPLMAAEHIGPCIKCTALAADAEELMLSNFADWAHGQHVWQNAQLDFYANRVRDFEHRIREYPLLGARFPLAKNLTNLIAQARAHTIESETWVRSRRWEQGEIFESVDMGAPPPHRTPEGRYNHAGRPVLYLGSDDVTCGAETVERNESSRIWLQSFRVTGKRVLDLSWFPNLEEALDNDQVDLLLAALHSAVHRPTEHQGHWKPEYYVPRFIADVVRWKGYDGILFNSVKGTGTNLVLFDPASGVSAEGQPRLLIYSGSEGIVRVPDAKPNPQELPCRSCGVVLDFLYRYCLACEDINPGYDVAAQP